MSCLLNSLRWRKQRLLPHPKTQHFCSILPKGKSTARWENNPKPINNADGGKKEKKKVKFPCKLCQEDHLTHQCPLIDQAQKLLKNQQPTILNDPFPQGQNAASVSNVAGGTANTPDQNYINMV